MRLDATPLPRRRQGQRTRTSRRGILLLVVLAIISVLALISAGLLYRMDAERMGADAQRDLQQARAAVDSGFQWLTFRLRDNRLDMDEWWNNQEYFRRTLVWAPDKIGGSMSLIDQEAIPGRPAWRFSIVSYIRQPDGEQVSIRYGVTPEAGKIHLNKVTRGQLLRLFDQFEFENVTSEELADALIDWRDADDELNSPNGAESAYYMTCRPSYRAKNRPFETVEELLLVRGFTGRILYGEDYNRNGYLDENEDDGEDGAFPPDDGDGILDQGVYPFLTVYSWDWNFANDNKPRYDINQLNWGEPDNLPEPLLAELNSSVIDFLAEAKNRGFKFRSVGELYGLEVYEDGSTNYDTAWDSYKELASLENKVQTEEGEESEEAEEEDQDSDDQGDMDQDQNEGDEDEMDDGQDDASNDSNENADGADQDRGRRTTARDRREQRNDQNNSTDEDNADDADKEQRQRQGVRGNDSDNGNSGTNEPGSGRRSAEDRRAERDRRMQEARDRAGGGGPGEEGDQGGEGDEQGNGRRGRRGGNDGGGNDGGGNDRDRNGGEGRGRGGENGGQGGNENGGGRGTGGGGTGGGGTGGVGGGGGEQPRDPGTPVISPATAEDMKVALDRLTVYNPAKNPALLGQINVNTAEPEVLKTVLGLTQEDVDGIVSQRSSMTGQDKLTPAWLIASGAVAPERFAVVSNEFTTRAIQFTADIIGFADHVGTARRLQVVIEMRGHMAQIRYYRDITSLGIGYPVKDDERTEGFAFTPQD